jgi:hypothetical protein
MPFKKIRTALLPVEFRKTAHFPFFPRKIGMWLCSQPPAKNSGSKIQMSRVKPRDYDVRSRRLFVCWLSTYQGYSNAPRTTLTIHLYFLLAPQLLFSVLKGWRSFDGVVGVFPRGSQGLKKKYETTSESEVAVKDSISGLMEHAESFRWLTKKIAALYTDRLSAQV